MTEREEALEPCPFCGEAPFMPIYDDHPINKWFVICDECETEGPHEYTEAEAIAAWNRRPLKPHAREEALEEAAKIFEEQVHSEWFGHEAADAIRALKSSPPPKGGDEQARSAAPLSASISHGNEGHDQ